MVIQDYDSAYGIFDIFNKYSRFGPFWFIFLQIEVFPSIDQFDYQFDLDLFPFIQPSLMWIPV